MTLFLVSLYLPYTVDFHIEAKDVLDETIYPAPDSRSKKLEAAAPVPNLLRTLSKTGSSQPSPPTTPGVSEYSDNIFIKGATSVISGIAGQKIGEQFRKALTQPHSRASSPPPSSILKMRPPHGIDKDIEVSGAPKSRKQPRKSFSAQDQTNLFADAPWSIESAVRGNGGLRNAIKAATESGGISDTLWVGTLGMSTDVLKDEMKAAIADRLATEHDCLPVYCKDSDFDGHYKHFCKQIIWPVFHYQIPDNPKSKAYEDHSWVYYVALNKAFAEVIIKNYKKGDIIWIHDYHLLLVPKMVREKIPEAMIGFFLHIAFPSSEVFRCLAMRKDLLEGMLGANLIGFQAEEYSRHFLQTCNRLLNVEATPAGVHLEDRFVNVTSSAIGVDPLILANERRDPKVEQTIKALRDRYGDRKLIVARDKLDNVRGIRQKMLAYELFLKKFPEWHDKTTLIQVATDHKESHDVQMNVLEIVSRINSSQSKVGHPPVFFYQNDMSHAEYLALLTVGDCLLITTLREGMNLTSHEYIFCQDERHSPLVLSEFTGSSDLFSGSEIKVNPWDYQECANAINQALKMSDDEKKTRWEKLYSDIMQNTAAHWVVSFIASLQKAWLDQRRRGNMAVPRLSLSAAGRAYAQTERRLFILDYEDTLLPWVSVKDVAHSQQRVNDILGDLLSDKRNMVYVMSSRIPEDLEQTFAVVAGVGLIAENGCFIRPRNQDTWIEMLNPDTLTWKTSVEEILDYYQERIPGTSVEKRHCSFIFHLEKAEDIQLASRQAGECVSQINDACENQQVHAVPTEKAVIVEPEHVNKSSAAEKLLGILEAEEKDDDGESWTPDYLFVAGNDREDEPVFQWANALQEQGRVGSVFTVYVGSRNTDATSTLGPTGLIAALQRIIKY